MSPRTIADASAQLDRLMHAIPALRDEERHKLSELAAIVGVSVEVLRRDLRTLVTRHEDEIQPGAFVEGVQLAFGTDEVRLRSKLFRRPMGLTPAELAALELGLTALQHETPPTEQADILAAKQLIVQAAPGMSVLDPVPEAHAHGAIPDVSEPLTALRHAVNTGRKARIGYLSGNATVPTERSVHPYGLISSNGRWYLIAFCDKATDIRIFRLDRVASVALLTEAATIPDPMKIEEQLQHNRALLNHAEEHLVVRFSASIARWIAEHEEIVEQPDGSVLVTYPLLDDEWAVRHVLGYGPAAEVLEPVRVRELVKARLAAMIATL